MITFNYLDLFNALAPETIVIVFAFLALLVDLAFLRRRPNRTRRTTGAGIAGAGCVAALLWLGFHDDGMVFSQALLTLSPLTQLAKQVLLVLTVFTVLLSVDPEFTDHVGEFFALVLLATASMMILVSTRNLLLIFVALEMTSLCLYILTAFHKGNLQSSEAALKYFLIGSVSAAFMLFGLSWLYGLGNTLDLEQLPAALGGAGREPIFYVALVMTLMGFGFKIAVVPFHLWAPDAYQGAPVPAAALIASGSKVASFFVLARVMIQGFAGAEGTAGWRHLTPGYLPTLAVLAVLSMVLGNLAALTQSSVRRLLAYSAIAHAGYMLVGLVAGNPLGTTALLFYVMTYALTVVGAFGVVAVAQGPGTDESFAAFAGLRKRAPVAAGCMLVFILSLAGVPPLVGFFGKVQLLLSALHSPLDEFGLLWLVILTIVMSTVSLYYYLQVLKQIFVVEPPEGSPKISPSYPTHLALVLLALLVVALGCAPGLLLDPLAAAIQSGLGAF